MTGPRPERMFTVNEIADILGVSRQTVYRIIQARELRALRIGHTLRVPSRALGRYITEADTTRDGAA